MDELLANSPVLHTFTFLLPLVGKVNSANHVTDAAGNVVSFGHVIDFSVVISVDLQENQFAEAGFTVGGSDVPLAIRDVLGLLVFDLAENKGDRRSSFGRREFVGSSLATIKLCVIAVLRDQYPFGLRLRLADGIDRE